MLLWRKKSGDSVWNMQLQVWLFTYCIKVFRKVKFVIDMTPKSFLESLFFFVIFLHLKLGKVLDVPRVIKWDLSEFSTRKLLKNRPSKIKEPFWSFLETSSKVLPNANTVLWSALLQTFELSANRKMSLIKISKKWDPRIELWEIAVVISRQLLK